MGSVVNTITIIQCWDKQEAHKIREEAVKDWIEYYKSQAIDLSSEIDTLISPVLRTVYNDEYTIIINGDGSKSGRSVGCKAEEFRKTWTEKIYNNHNYCVLSVFSISTECDGGWIEYNVPKEVI